MSAKIIFFSNGANNHLDVDPYLLVMATRPAALQVCRNDQVIRVRTYPSNKGKKNKKMMLVINQQSARADVDHA